MLAVARDACPGAVEPGFGALDEPPAFLLGNPAEDGDEERPDGPRGVEPRLAHTDDRNSDSVTLQDILDRAEHRAMETVESPHDDRPDAAGAGIRHHAVEHWPRLRGGLDLFVGDRLETARLRELKQFSVLVLDGLLVGRDPDVKSGPEHIEIVTPSNASGRRGALAHAEVQPGYQARRASRKKRDRELHPRPSISDDHLARRKYTSKPRLQTTASLFQADVP